VYLGFLGIAVLSVAVLARAFYIQRVEGNHWRSMSDSLHQRFVALEAERGTIYSEDGQMLSTSIPSFDIYLDLAADGLRDKKGKVFNENIDSFCIALSNYFGDKPAAAYEKEIRKAYGKKNRYYPLKKKLSFADYKAFRSFPLARLGKNKSGVIVEVQTRRLMPYGLLANRTIGLSREHIASNGKVKKQNVGLEKSYDSLLSGRDGQKLVRFIAGGTAIPIEGTETDPQHGKDIFTTLDVNIQDITETALMRMMQQCEGPYGTAIVMETKTGKIRAMANLGRRPDGSYWEDDNYALRATEPGSTIKLVTLLSVLEKGTSRIDDMVEVGSAGRMQVGKKMVTDAERSPKSSMNVLECFAHSSNVGMSKLAYKAFAKNPAELKEYMRKFYMDTRSPIDLSHVPRPTMAPLNQKGSAEGNMLWMSFGYGIQVSPLQTLTLYNAIANNGRMMKPYLVSQVRSNGILETVFEPHVMEEQLCRADVVKAARASMEAVVTEGTARRAFAGLPFSVAGKTGTAHVSDGRIKYDHGVYQASFVGYFPADDPQFSCIVLIRTKPHAASHYGGTLAAPVFREIAGKLYAMYVENKNPSLYAARRDSSLRVFGGHAGDIRRVYQAMQQPLVDSTASDPWGQVLAGGNGIVMKGGKLPQDVMPNVKGMGLRDAVYILETLGLKVMVKGKGRVIAQSLTPGMRLAKGITVTIELG
jgi:cell division protein FtsI (penicillin-binding protein 3)